MDRHIPLNTLKFSSLPTIPGIAAVCFQPPPIFSFYPFFILVGDPSWTTRSPELCPDGNHKLPKEGKCVFGNRQTGARTDGRMDGVCLEGQARSAREMCGILGYVNRASGNVPFRFFSFFLLRRKQGRMGNGRYGV